MVASEDTKFVFRFPSRDIRQQFKIEAATLDKTMTELLGEIVVQYLKETKEA